VTRQGAVLPGKALRMYNICRVNRSDALTADGGEQLRLAAALRLKLERLGGRREDYLESRSFGLSVTVELTLELVSELQDHRRYVDRICRGAYVFVTNMLTGKQRAWSNANSLRLSPQVDATTNAGREAAAFVTTHWSVVLTAQGDSPAAQEALEELCRTYWRPIYAFVRRQGFRPEEAEDVTQGFFALLLERKDLSTVRSEKGRLRSYLLASVKHFLADERRRAMAVKRGKRQQLIPFDELSVIEMDLLDPLTPDMIYERRWAFTVLERVLARLGTEYRAAGNRALFDLLKQLLPDEPGAPSRAEIAARLGMREDAVRQAFRRFRHRYHLLLREEIGHTVATVSEVEDELRHLIAVLRT
jgi:RNA polymerase sigma factor (sigma-70 family)